jgi:subtilisin-like proprotein convertase family protein
MSVICSSSSRRRALVGATLPALAMTFIPLLAAPAAAQEKVHTYENTPAASIPVVTYTFTPGGTTSFTSTGAAVAIPDNGYNGSQASMGCKSINVPSDGFDLILGPVTVTVPITHTWVGDLTVKLFTPSGSFTLMSRPGYSETADDGSGGNGDSSNLSASSPVTFAMSSGTEAENMGNTIGDTQTVCTSDGICSFNPNNGASTLSEDLADLNLDNKVGTWSLCVGDAVTADTGTLGNWTLNVPSQQRNDTCTTNGLAQTITVPASDSFNVATIGVALNISHANRGDIRAMLRAPSGALLDPLFTDSAADTNDNYDITMAVNSDPSGPPPLNDGTLDPVGEPYYARMVHAPAINFYGGTANGNWTLYLCDGSNNSISGTLNRAKLVLTEPAAATPICTGTPLTYNWADNGNDAYFDNITTGGVTLTLTSSRDLTSDEDNTTGGRRNFTTRTDEFGAQTSHFLMTFDDVDPQDPEEVLLETSWSLSPPVRGLSWLHLDMDFATGAWEDYVRLEGRDSLGNVVPYQVSPVSGTPSFERHADVLQGDTGNVANTSNAGNAAYVFDGEVAAVTVQYMEGDDVADPDEQRIGIGNATWCCFDYGDAPNTYGTQLSGGARHVLGNRTLYLGTYPPDGESDGAPGTAATTDDTTQVPSSSIDDEDGVASFPYYVWPSTTYTVSVTAVNLSATTAGNLVGYIDWNRDGDFADTDEISLTTNVPANTNSPTAFDVTWNNVPINAGGKTATYARFRIAYVAAEAQLPTGLANSGEVEDYPIAENTLPVTIAHVESFADGGLLTVRWTTASEWANGGFAVSGRGAGQDSWTVLAEVAAHAPDSMTPQRYEAVVDALGIDEIVIEDLSLFGERRSHGPFKVGETAGEEPEGLTIDWAAVKAELAAAPAASAARTGMMVSAAAAASATEGLLLVREEGVHRVTHEQLLAAGIDLSGTPAARINLFDNGKAVARWVSTPAGTFGPGSFVEFVGRPALTLASPYDAYTLRVQRTNVTPPAALPAGASATAAFTAEDRHAPDRVYGFSSPNGDPWYDQGLLARGSAATLTRTFDLPDLAAGAVQLTVRAWGYGDWPGNTPPDHHVVVSLNGSVIADERFDGVTAWESTVDVTALVTPAGNTLELRVPGDTGYMFDYMAFEGYSVRYQRQTVALDRRFQGTIPAGTGFVIGGFPDGETVALWRLKGKTWQRGEQTAGGGQVTVKGNGSVWAAAQSGLLTPGIVAGVPAPLDFSTAQYVVVTHPALAGALGDLVALQQGRGLSTEVVTTDRIYAAYSDHATSADALKFFLTTSSKKRTLKYVVLVGADTTDPHNHLGLGSMTLVPTAYLSFVQYVSFSPSDETLVDADGDSLGEVPIGRLPARTPSEVEEMVAKILAWEQNVAPSGRGALLAAGGNGSLFASINQSYANTLDTWAPTVVSVGTQGTAAVRGAVLAALNAGTPLVSYVGHSSIGQWDFTPVLTWQDIASLTNTGRPNLLVQWGCWNAYYVEPNVESLSARLMRTPGVGAAATIGATTLTTESSHMALGTLFYQKLNGTPASVGEAFHAAKVELLTSGAPKDALLGMAFLGDPAMSAPR